MNAFDGQSEIGDASRHVAFDENILAFDISMHNGRLVRLLVAQIFFMQERQTAQHTGGQTKSFMDRNRVALNERNLFHVQSSTFPQGVLPSRNRTSTHVRETQ